MDEKRDNIKESVEDNSTRLNNNESFEQAERRITQEFNDTISGLSILL